MRSILLTAAITAQTISLGNLRACGTPSPTPVPTPDPISLDLTCPDTEQSTASNLHYPGWMNMDCTAATVDAESNLASYHYRNTCNLEFGSDINAPALDADVFSCQVAPPGFSDGVVVTVDVCCPVLDEEICDDGLDNDGDGEIDEDCGLTCPLTEQATTSGLHYPGWTGMDCAAAIADSEANLGSYHYRNACNLEFGSDINAPALDADVFSCQVAPPGFSDGVVVTVDVCCPVLDEEICDDGLDNDGDGEIDEDCGLTCDDTERASANGLHYPGSMGFDCADAIADAEANLGSFHYRNACHQTLGSDLASPVLGAEVVSCEVTPPGFSDGVVVDVEVCCPE